MNDNVDRGFLSRVELFLLFAFAAIGTAILAPTLLRADRASNEAQAIADAWTVYRAEESYAAANFGLYSEPRYLCRSGPECLGIGIPGYPASAPEFISGELGRRSDFVKDGYRHHWTITDSARHRPALSDPHSQAGYCYRLEPDLASLSGQRTFAIDGSGRMFEEPFGGSIACPIDDVAYLLETPRPALAVDFGRRGLWRYDGDDHWIRLARSNPVLLIARDETLLATFKGKKGLHLLDGTGWRRIARKTPTQVVPIVGGLVARFRSQSGLWYWDETEWTQITPWEPEAMEVQGNKLIVDFGSEGLWMFWKPIGMLSDRDPAFVHAGRYVLADLDDGRGTQELYLEDLTGGDFWWYPFYHDTLEDVFMLERASPYTDNILAADRGVAGTWLGDTKVHSWDPYLLSHLDRDLVAAFRGHGLYRFEDAANWVELSTSEPIELAAADRYVGAIFKDLRGVHRFDSSASKQITRWRAEAVIAVDLAAPSQSWELRSARRCPVPQSERGEDSCRRLARGGAP